MSINYFNEKEQVKKRQPHKRKAEKVIKKEAVRIIFEKFIDFKLKQNLRPATLNKLITNFKGVEKFHSTRIDQPFYIADITTDFLTDWVYWMKHEAV